MKRFSMVEAFAFSEATIKKFPLLILGPAILFKSLESAMTYFLNDRNLEKDLSELPPLLFQWLRKLPLQQVILWCLLILFVAILMAILSATVSIGQIRIACHAFDGQNDRISWSEYKNFGKKILLPFTAYYLFMLVTSFFGFWITPWFIFALIYLFTFYVLVEKRVTLKDALRTSYRLTKGIKWSLVAFFLVYVLIIMIIELPLFLIANFLGSSADLLFFFVHPILQVFLTLATIYIYKDISYQDAHPDIPSGEVDQTVQDSDSGDEIRIPIETLLNH